MNENDLILKELKKQTLLSRIRLAAGIICAAALTFLAVCFARITPVIISAADTAVQTVNELKPRAEKLMEDLDDTASALEKTADELGRSASSIGESDLDSLFSAIDNIGKIDIDELNRSIKGLSDIVAPLAGLFAL